MCIYKRAIFECKHVSWGCCVKRCTIGEDFDQRAIAHDCAVQSSHALHSRKVSQECGRCLRLKSAAERFRANVQGCREAFSVMGPVRPAGQLSDAGAQSTRRDEKAQRGESTGVRFSEKSGPGSPTDVSRGSPVVAKDNSSVVEKDDSPVAAKDKSPTPEENSSSTNEEKVGCLSPPEGVVHQTRDGQAKEIPESPERANVEKAELSASNSSIIPIEATHDSRHVECNIPQPRKTVSRLPGPRSVPRDQKSAPATTSASQPSQGPKVALKKDRVMGRRIPSPCGIPKPGVKGLLGDSPISGRSFRQAVRTTLIGKR